MRVRCGGGASSQGVEGVLVLTRTWMNWTHAGSGSFSTLNLFMVGRTLPHGPQLSEYTSSTEKEKENREHLNKLRNSCARL